MAVLDAWAYGLPVLMTAHCNLSEGFHHAAAFEIGTSPESISNVINDLRSMRMSDFVAMSQSARQLVARHYSLETISRELLSVYKWMTGDSARPECEFNNLAAAA